MRFCFEINVNKYLVSLVCRDTTLLPFLNDWLKFLGNRTCENTMAGLREIFISCLWCLPLANPELVVLIFSDQSDLNNEIHFTVVIQYIKNPSLRSVLQFSFPPLASPHTIPPAFAFFSLEVSPSLLIPSGSSVYTEDSLPRTAYTVLGSELINLPASTI